MGFLWNSSSFPISACPFVFPWCEIAPFSPFHHLFYYFIIIFLVLKYGIMNDVALSLNVFLAYNRNVHMNHHKDAHSILSWRNIILSDVSHKYSAFHAMKEQSASSLELIIHWQPLERWALKPKIDWDQRDTMAKKKKDQCSFFADFMECFLELLFLLLVNSVPQNKNRKPLLKYLGHYSLWLTPI